MARLAGSRFFPRSSTLNALDNPFVYDDFRTVLENPSIDDVWAVQTIVYREITRPLVNFSYAVDRAIWGGSLFGYPRDQRAAACPQRAAAVPVGTADGRRPAGPPGGEPDSRPIRATVVAIATAGAFGLHPMMTEAVGYISGRSEVLCAVFFLGALLAARRWMLGEGRVWIVAAVGLWAGAMLSKEVAATWPLVVLGYDRVVIAGDPAAARRRWRRVIGPLLGLTLLAGIGQAGGADPGRESWQRRHLLAVRVRRNGGDAPLLPADDVARKPVDLPPGERARRPPSPQIALALLWLAAWLGTAWKLSRHEGAIALGMAWFVLLLVPSSVLVLLDLGEPMAEHRVYLAAAGLFLATGHRHRSRVGVLQLRTGRAPWFCEWRWRPGLLSSAA